MPWSETEKPAVSADSNFTQRTSRRFRVWDASPEQLLSDPTAILQSDDNPIGLPGYNEQFPGFPSLKLDRYEVSNDKPIFDATAYYSNDRRFTFPRTQNQEPDISLWSGSFETVSFQLPFARLITQSIADPNGGVPVEVYGWEFEKQPVSETRMKFGRSVLNESNLSIGLQAIRENNNKLQLIGGTWYLFKAGNFRQPDPLTWEVTYSFILDEGTKSYRNVDLVINNIVLPPNTTKFPELFGVDVTWVRPPYCDIIIKDRATAPLPAGTVSLLDFVPVCAFDISANNGTGWQSLPGLNL